MPRGARVIGRLSIVLGWIGILGLPLLIVVTTALHVRFPTWLSRAADFVFGNLHWGDPQIAIGKGLILDVPLAVMLLISGKRTMQGRALGRTLALFYAGLILCLELLAFAGIFYPNREEIAAQIWRASLPSVVDTAVGSLILKVAYPIVLLAYYLRPSTRRQFAQPSP